MKVIHNCEKNLEFIVSSKTNFKDNEKLRLSFYCCKKCEKIFFVNSNFGVEDRYLLPEKYEGLFNKEELIKKVPKLYYWDARNLL